MEHAATEPWTEPAASAFPGCVSCGGVNSCAWAGGGAGDGRAGCAGRLPRGGSGGDDADLGRTRLRAVHAGAVLVEDARALDESWLFLPPIQVTARALGRADGR